MAATDSNPHFQGRKLLLTRIIWAFAFMWTVGLFGAGMMLSYADYLSGNVPDIVMAKLTLPASPFLNTRLFRVIEFTAPIVFLIAGTLLFWRLGKYKIAWLTSLSMITGVPATSAPILSLGNNRPEWYPLMAGLQAFGFTLFITYFYIFPDGRFKPTWTQAAALLMLLFALSYPFCRQCNPFSTRSTIPLWILSGFLLLGLMAQLYRYLYLSSPTERQQSKWVVLGFVIMVTGTTIIILSRIIFPSLIFYKPFGSLFDFFLIPLAFLLQLAVPVTFLLAITRSRLWDVDIIIRKTLQYTVLTSLLVLIYFGMIVLLQSVFVSISGQQSPIAIVISTLVIYGLSAPLRRRIQDVIDRRFYRQKYDAQQVLAQFAQTARDETDMDALTAELIRVVQETMQPEGVSLWLKRE